MNRIDRLSAILIMLQSSSIVKIKQITDRFNISTRTVYRDLRALEDSGIPLAGDSRTGYSLVEGFKLPPLMFTQEEAFSFIAAEKLIDKFTDKGFKSSYKSGIEKIKAVMRLAEIKTIEDFNNKIGTLNYHLKNSESTQNILHELIDGAAKRKKVYITYYSYNRNETTDRTVDPIGIFFSMSNWYLIAFCNTVKDYRTFRISRIQNITQTNKGFELNHPPLESFLKTLGDREHLQKIVIEVNEKDMLLIDENRYYQGLITEKEVNGKIELHFMTFSFDRFARWYLSYIDIARIVYPVEFKTIVKEILSNANL